LNSGGNMPKDLTDDTKAPAFGLRLPQDILATIDRHRMGLPYPVSRSAVLRRIIEEWVESRTPKPRVRPEE
jgi:hypothetical protein